MAKNPMLEFMIKLPTSVRIVTTFTKGDGEYGPWWGWEVLNEGVTKTMFTDEDLQGKIAGYLAGTDLTITKMQTVGSKAFTWQVVPAGMQPPPSLQQPPTTTIPMRATAYPPIQRVMDRAGYRMERVLRAKDALEDSMEALNLPVVDENVRALAISFLIDEQRKGIPADDTAAF